MSDRKVLAAGFASWLVLWLPVVRGALEGDMAVHMAVQMPLLIALGVLFAAAARRRRLARHSRHRRSGAGNVVLDAAAGDGSGHLQSVRRSCQIPEPAAPGRGAVGRELAADAAARPRVHLGQFHSQARRHWRTLSRRADAALLVLPIGS